MKLYLGVNSDVPVDKYITLPSGSIEKMFDCVLDWESDYQVIEL